jgi:hypothetical protein
MEALAESVVFWTLILVQPAGLAALALFRLEQRGGIRKRCHWIFLLSLGVVGSAAIFSLATGSGSWAASVSTLSVMSLGAVLDIGAAPAAETF